MEEDILFAAMTRPAMIWGVTYTGLILNLTFTVCMFVGFNNLCYLLLFLPIHFVMYLVCWKEPRYFETCKVWILTKGNSKARLFWQASTYGH